MADMRIPPTTPPQGTPSPGRGPEISPDLKEIKRKVEDFAKVARTNNERASNSQITGHAPNSAEADRIEAAAKRRFG